MHETTRLGSPVSNSPGQVLVRPAFPFLKFNCLCARLKLANGIRPDPIAEERQFGEQAKSPEEKLWQNTFLRDFSLHFMESQSLPDVGSRLVMLFDGNRQPNGGL